MTNRTAGYVKVVLLSWGIGFFAFLCVIIVVGFLIQMFVCFLMYKPISKLPDNFQPFRPEFVFLMLVSIANFVIPFLNSLLVTDAFKN